LNTINRFINFKHTCYIQIIMLLKKKICVQLIINSMDNYFFYLFYDVFIMWYIIFKTCLSQKRHMSTLKGGEVTLNYQKFFEN
jgi:hypothetical protein